MGPASLEAESHTEEHGWLYRIVVWFTRRRTAIGLTTYVLNIHTGPKCLHTMGPFHDVHPRASSQISSSPILWPSLLTSMTVWLNHLLPSTSSPLFPGESKHVIPLRVLPTERIFHLYFSGTQQCIWGWYQLIMQSICKVCFIFLFL